MSVSSRATRAVRFAAFVAAAAVIAGCRHQAEPATIEPPPALPPQLLTAPTLSPSSSVSAFPDRALAADTAKEPHVDIDTHGGETDVRLLLDFLASKGGFTLVYSPGINRRVRVQMLDVPISVALQTLLSVAGLTIETTAPGAKTPGSGSVVFYQLPVNVDSLSVEALMKRFGIGRSMAEVIVQSRTIKP